MNTNDYYSAIVDEKVARVSQEVVRLDVEGDRRRTSMLVQGVLDQDLYLAGLADFLLCITETMKLDHRRSGGKMICFEEGVLCQQKLVFPGCHAKLSTGNEGGWFSAMVATVRRLIHKNDLDMDNDWATVMQKTSINFLNVDKEKAITILKALKDYEATQISYNIGERMIVQSGKIVHDYIRETAAMTKRIFVRESENRIREAKKRFDNSIEADGCYRRLNSRDDKTVLRFCKCTSTECPVNVLFARFLV